MPNLYNYRLFISHAWKYGPDYIRLVNLLDNASYFSYHNYSAPRENLFFLLVHLTHLQILQIK
mgnify:FL=1